MERVAERKILVGVSKAESGLDSEGEPELEQV